VIRANQDRGRFESKKRMSQLTVNPTTTTVPILLRRWWFHFSRNDRSKRRVFLHLIASIHYNTIYYIPTMVYTVWPVFFTRCDERWLNRFSFFFFCETVGIYINISIHSRVQSPKILTQPRLTDRMVAAAGVFTNKNSENEKVNENSQPSSWQYNISCALNYNYYYC